MQAYADPRILRGMERQFKLRQQRLAEGDKPIGWKVGFGTPAAMDRLAIDAPLIGFLTEGTLLESGATVSIAGWTRAALEPEIAVYIAKNLPAGPDREMAAAAVGAIGPAIELADVSFPPEEVEAMLAENLYNRLVILGRKDTSRAGCVLEGLVGRIYRDGTEAAVTTNPQALTGDLIEIVRYVADLLSTLGERLRSGDVVITGSIVPPIWLESEEEIRFALDPIDQISVKVTPAITV